MKLNIPKPATKEKPLWNGMDFACNTMHVWHIRVQLWRYGKRKRRQAYRIVAESKQQALNILPHRLPTVRGRVVTRCVQGKAV